MAVHRESEPIGNIQNHPATSRFNFDFSLSSISFQNADQVERFNEMGELRKMLKTFKVKLNNSKKKLSSRSKIFNFPFSFSVLRLDQNLPNLWGL